jgi:hypothetical protein
MSQKFRIEEEDIICFFAWSSNHSIYDISQEMKEALLFIVNQLPDISKTLLTRLGGILRLTLQSPDWNDSFWDKNEEQQNEIRLNSVDELLDKHALKEDLKEMYLNFAKFIIISINDNSQLSELRDLIKLITEKETNS